MISCSCISIATHTVYMAPEVMEQAGGYDFHADIWSVGIAALELAKGVAPYAHLSAMRVLVLTIEEPPPTLKVYPNDRQRDGAPFSSNFDDFYKKCLQKKPQLRPSTEDLLKHKFLKNRSCYALVDQLLKHIPSVGQSSSTRPSAEELRRRLLPGEGPVAIELFERKQGDSGSNGSNGNANSSYCPDSGGNGPLADTGMAVSPKSSSMHTPRSPNSPAGRGKPAPPVYVSGTTWVFDGDDEQVGIGKSGEVHRIIRVSSRALGRSSSAKTNNLTCSTSSSSSSSSTKNDEFCHSSGIDSFLTDFEADAATIKSTIPSKKGEVEVAAVPPPIVRQPSYTPPQGIRETRKAIEKCTDDDDAFMDEMEGICSTEN
jgi:serine/threonine protein kinase